MLPFFIPLIDATLTNCQLLDLSVALLAGLSPKERVVVVSCVGAFQNREDRFPIL
jgi:protein-tyrosine phosphatase